MTQETLANFVSESVAPDTDKTGEPELRRETSSQQPPEETTVLFRLTSDPFVNEAIADLARRLVDRGRVTVQPDRITLASDASLDATLEHIRDMITAGSERMYARTSTARDINAALDRAGFETDERRVPPYHRSFGAVTSDPVSVYPDDTVSMAVVENHGVPTDNLDIDSERGLYTVAPTFVGSTTEDDHTNQEVRFNRYFEAFATALHDDTEIQDRPCLACGRETLPTYKDDDGEKLEYNQTFSLLAATSGQLRPLGAKKRDSKHTGRCAACLVAGFYYTVLPEKVVRPTASNENDVRVFTPVGDLNELVTIRENIVSRYDTADPDTPVNRPVRRTFGNIPVAARGMQVLDFYEVVYRHLNTTYSGTAFDRRVERHPTELLTYVSRVGQTREILAIETATPGAWAYDAVRQRSFNDEQYWPVEDVLQWFTHLDSRAMALTDAINTLAFGILDLNLARIERALLATAKAVDRGGAEIVRYLPHRGYSHEYFTHVMSHAVTDTTDRIDADDIECIQRVASGLGRIFHSTDDIGMLIQLQNASTPDEFLTVFEKAAMQAQKKSLDDAPSRFDTARDDDVATVLELINDADTFNATKRMFVIHASLAAQYANAQRINSDDDATGGTDE